MKETKEYTLYNDTVMDHFLNPRNMGDVQEADGIGEVGAAACGDIMKISLKIRGGKIEDDADCVYAEGADDEIWWNYRCSNCRTTFQELPTK